MSIRKSQKTNLKVNTSERDEKNVSSLYSPHFKVVHHANINISVTDVRQIFFYGSATFVFHTRQSKWIKTNNSTFAVAMWKKKSFGLFYVSFVILLPPFGNGFLSFYVHFISLNRNLTRPFCTFVSKCTLQKHRIYETKSATVRSN